jgi:GT2 family glycosyltransferase
MPKVALIQVVYNSLRFIPQVFQAALNQTYKNMEIVAVISGNNDKGREYIEKNFPSVKVIDPGYNIGFAKGHNIFFEKSDADFFQLFNPDLIMTPQYVEEMLKAFEDPAVGGANGKLFKYDFSKDQPIFY